MQANRYGIPPLQPRLLTLFSLEWIIEEGEIGYRIKNAASNTYIGYFMEETLGDRSCVTGNEHLVEYEIEGDLSNGYTYVCA
jgi:hypothetical protein